MIQSRQAFEMTNSNGAAPTIDSECRGDGGFEQDAVNKPALNLYLAAPRGYCAGVERAIKIVELTLEKWGAPVFVLHEIIHNRFVVDRLRESGAVFVDEVSQCPDDRPIIFSAHGVPKSVVEAASSRRMTYLDATCPLVTKVHVEAARHYAAGRRVIMIGHANHPETAGTIGQLPEGEVILVETLEDVDRLDLDPDSKLAYVTQTTLSLDDTQEIVSALIDKFSNLSGPHKKDICYATANRQEAIKRISPLIDALIVIGAPNSSNSKRLVEVGKKCGCAYAQLVQRATDLDWRALAGARSVGLSAGASAPEQLVDEVIDAFSNRYEVVLEEIEVAKENYVFSLPASLRAGAV